MREKKEEKWSDAHETIFLSTSSLDNIYVTFCILTSMPLPIPIQFILPPPFIKLT